MKPLNIIFSVYLFSLMSIVSHAHTAFDDANLAVLTQNIRGDEIQFFDDVNAFPPSNSLYLTDKEKILQEAYRLSGIPYRAGGNSPETGFDCSGFVRYVFSQTTNTTLPTTARAISKIGKSIDKEDLQAGDLVFFNTLKHPYSHVAIYVGDHQFIHAPSPGGVVRVDQLNSAYWSSHFNGAKRITID